jgi:hypothetical protein
MIDLTQVKFPSGSIGQVLTLVSSSTANWQTQSGSFDSSVVHVAGSETITGQKTFDQLIIGKGIQNITDGFVPTDVCVEVSVPWSDEFLEPGAKIFSVATGEGSKFSITKQGMFSSVPFYGSGNGYDGGYFYAGAAGASSYCLLNGVVASTLAGPNGVSSTVNSRGTSSLEYFDYFSNNLSRVSTIANGVIILSSKGTGSSDVCLKVGSSTSGSLINASAKLFSVRSGLGETETEYLYVTKSGLSASNLSGVNTGDQDLTGYATTSSLNSLSGTCAATDTWLSGTINFLSGTINARINSVDSSAVHIAGTESVTGTKTFTAAVTAVSGVLTNDLYANYATGSLVIYSQNCTGSADVGVKVGTSVVDASVSTTAKIFSVRNGIGGTEVEAFYVNKAGNYLDIGFGGNWKWSSFGGTSMALIYGSTVGMMHNVGVESYLAGVATPVSVRSPGGSGATDVCVRVGSTLADASVNATAKLFSVRTGIAATEVEKLSISSAGRVDQFGTDSSGTPGNATINKPTGISAIASGSSTCVITNSLATLTCRPKITWYGDHGATRDWVNRASGSMTVELSSPASADTSFGWEISYLL